ncbi:MAG: SDR family oxidoreductase, partial [Clostridiales bacterium]
MKKVLLITGGSSGIGLATAQLFAEKGWQVFEFSRRGLAEAGIIHIFADLRDEQSIKTAFQQFSELSNHLDLLINNAGFGISGPIEFTDLSTAKEQFEVNFFGAFCCIKEALPLLRKSKGQIINLSSVAAPFAIPFQAFYSASKSAINALTLALANEVATFGIKVSALMPGDAHTGFTAARHKNQNGLDLYGQSMEKAVNAMEQDELTGMTPQFVAKRIYKISTISCPKPLYTAGGKYQFLVFL